MQQLSVEIDLSVSKVIKVSSISEILIFQAKFSQILFRPEAKRCGVRRFLRFSFARLMIRRQYDVKSSLGKILPERALVAYEEPG